jgi:hypothetical protein
LKRFFNYWAEQAQWWSSRKLEWWAAHVTAFYFGGSLLVIAAKFDELILLKLNEIGDLAAGVFGPLAFLWLVLGYIQQGRELRISSESLKMQADELRASVEQQTAMVEVSRRQLEADLEASAHQREQVERQAEPDIRVKYYDVVYSPGRNARFEISNVGPKCESVEVILEKESHEGYELLTSFGYLDGRGVQFITLPFALLSVSESVFVKFTYLKINGNRSAQRFGFLKVENNGNQDSAKAYKYISPSQV